MPGQSIKVLIIERSVFAILFLAFIGAWLSVNRAQAVFFHLMKENPSNTTVKNLLGPGPITIREVAQNKDGQVRKHPY